MFVLKDSETKKLVESCTKEVYRSAFVSSTMKTMLFLVAKGYVTENEALRLAQFFKEELGVEWHND